MITASFNIAIYTVIFFLVGIFKPNWALFFMKNPNRLTVIILSLVLTMVAVTLYGEGNRQLKLQKETPSQQEFPYAEIPK